MRGHLCPMPDVTLSPIALGVFPWQRASPGPAPGSGDRAGDPVPASGTALSPVSPYQHAGAQQEAVHGLGDVGRVHLVVVRIPELSVAGFQRLQQRRQERAGDLGMGQGGHGGGTDPERVREVLGSISGVLGRDFMVLKGSLGVLGGSSGVQGFLGRVPGVFWGCLGCSGVFWGFGTP